jgi:hypothetical protein
LSLHILLNSHPPFIIISWEEYFIEFIIIFNKGSACIIKFLFFSESIAILDNPHKDCDIISSLSNVNNLINSLIIPLDIKISQYSDLSLAIFVKTHADSYCNFGISSIVKNLINIEIISIFIISSKGASFFIDVNYLNPVTALILSSSLQEYIKFFKYGISLIEIISIIFYQSFTE